MLLTSEIASDIKVHIHDLYVCIGVNDPTLIAAGDETVQQRYPIESGVPSFAPLQSC